MSDTHFCQSCGMPLDDLDLWGTEKDGSRTNEYCKYCYKEGQFIHPEASLDDFMKHTTTVMKKKRLPDAIIERSVATLPFLKRWRAKMPAKT